jgi:hypothetical protein
VWWHRPVISRCKRVRQEDGKFEASLGYTERPYLKTKQNKKQKDISERKPASELGTG